MAPPKDPDQRPGSGRLPRNRVRLLFIALVVLVLVVIFGYMLIVSGVGNS
jgi:flagellar basal body-associated protein FliL